MVFKPGNAAGGGNRGSTKLVKPYTEAIRAILETAVGAYPEGWPADQKTWTNAQELAWRHMLHALSAALRGELGMAELIIGRAEGKIPTAPEDRELGDELKKHLLNGVPALHALYLALGLRKATDPITVEVIDTPALPPKSDA